MSEIGRVLQANEAYAAARAHVADPRPSRHLAVITCMDSRIDVFAVLGLHLGEAHVIRNAGGRVTDDVLRSLALSVHVLGIDTVIVMQHTKCGLAGVTDEELRRRTGADLGFFPIDEIPQVMNVLRGDLSVVGPRPEQQRYVEELSEDIRFYNLRHLARPGITGWAQVKYPYGSSHLDALEKLQYDFYYLRHQSFMLDLRIIGRTLRSISLCRES